MDIPGIQPTSGPAYIVFLILLNISFLPLLVWTYIALRDIKNHKEDKEKLEKELKKIDEEMKEDD